MEYVVNNGDGKFNTIIIMNKNKNDSFFAIFRKGWPILNSIFLGLGFYNYLWFLLITQKTEDGIHHFAEKTSLFLVNYEYATGLE